MKTRRYKVTCWVEVPIVGKGSELRIRNTDDIEQYISDKLAEDGIYGDYEADKEPLIDAITIDCGDGHEDITSFNKPGGYIAPDGIFYGMEYDIDPLVHISLAHELYEYYKDIYPPSEHSTIGIDHTLELMGFITIADTVCRYYCAYNKPIYWTEAQCETIYRWMKNREEYYSDAGQYICSFGESGRVHSSEFIQMDKFAILKKFEI